MRFIEKLLLTGLCFGACGPCVLATPLDPIPPKVLLDVRMIGEGSRPDFSPDGMWVAYAVRENLHEDLSGSNPGTDGCSAVPWHALGSRIELSEVATGQSVELGERKEDSWLPRWSPDGRDLAFLSDRDGSGHAKLWVWERGRNIFKKISDVPIDAEQIEWAPDGKEIFTTVRHSNAGTQPDECRESRSTGSERSQGRPEKSSVVFYESSPHTGIAAVSDPWSLDQKIRDIASFNLDTGEFRALTSGERVDWFELSPDGTRIAFSSPIRFERPGSQQIQFDLAVIILVGGAKSVAARDVRLSVRGRAFAWSPDSSGLVFATGGPLSPAGDCYRVDSDGSNLLALTSLEAGRQLDSAFFPPVFSQDGRRIYFLRNGAVWTASMDGGGAHEFAAIPGRRILEILASKGKIVSAGGENVSMIVLTNDAGTKQDGFWSIDLGSGSSQVLLERRQCYWFGYDRQFVAASADARALVFSAQDAKHPADLWVSDTEFRRLRQLTHLNRGIESYKMGAAQLIHWRSLDGTELSGALLLPPDYLNGMRCPLIVWVYGGEFLSDDIDQFGFVGLGQPFNLQLLATRGYAVLAPDAPQQMGTPMVDLAKTVLPGVDRVVEMGIADPERTGLMGFSYGGYSVLSLLVLTTRFRAAIVGDGFGDLIGAYGQLNPDGSSYATSREQGQELMGGTPWEFRDRYIENSPIFYLDRIETPVLLIHGGADRWVHPFLADEVFVGLRRLGKEVAYAKYPGEDHAPTIWSSVNQLDLSNRIIAWFKSCLGGG